MLARLFDENPRFDFEVGALLAEIRAKHGTQCAYVTIDGLDPKTYLPVGRREIFFSEVVDRAQALAAHLRASGVRPGDRVALVLESSPEWMMSFLAILLCEAVAVPIDVKLSPREMLSIFSHAEPRALLRGPKFAGLADSIPQFEITRAFIEKTAARPGRPAPMRGLHCDDLALIVYTSGSSGDPRGVMIRLSSVVFEVNALQAAVPTDDSNTFLSILPPNHMLELSGGLMSTLLKGVRVAFCGSLMPDEIVAQMRAEKVTGMICVPLFLRAFRKSIHMKATRNPLGRLWFAATSWLAGRLPWVSVRRALFWPIHRKLGGQLQRLICGGAPLEKDVARFFDLMGVTVLQGYGLTETSPVVTVATESHNRPGSVGRVLRGVEIRVTERGEILVRGPNLMIGYLGREDLTREAIDADGWFHTGDLGYIDIDGYLFITGRSKELIVLGNGKKVFPDEVEHLLVAGVPAELAKELCVVGARSRSGPNAGSEEVCVACVPMPGQEERLRDSIQRVCREISPYKRPTRVIMRKESLPRTTTYKVKRAALKAWIENLNPDGTEL